jgi:hypothetical protein
MAEEDFADTHKADFALEADRRNGFDFESFIDKFYSRSSVDAGRMGSAPPPFEPVRIIVPFPAAGAMWELAHSSHMWNFMLSYRS